VVDADIGVVMDGGCAVGKGHGVLYREFRVAVERQYQLF
jgi:hypothetical protein